ncbi:hypothetical protein BsWGS_16229 [Bradybaena similaris]
MKYVNHTSLLLCILDIIYVSLSMAKLCPYTNKNCLCIKKTVACGSLQTIPPLNIGSDVIAVDSVRFAEGQITSVPENSLPPSLVSIEFSDNPLTNISDAAFSNSSATLKSLAIRSATFSQIPQAIAKLTALETLSLDTVRINDWNSPALQNIFGTLKSLTIRNVTFTQIPQAFAKLSILETLRLVAIPINDWNRSALQNIVGTLRTLDLINMNLSVWPRWISDCTLKNVFINRAIFHSIPDDAFVSMNQSLTSFSVLNSGLTQVPKALTSLLNLTVLEISGSHLENVGGREGFEQITTFPLANTLLTLIGTNLYLKSLPNFSALKSLASLNLYRNEIPEVTSGILPQRLVTLSLGYNSITKLTNTSFASLVLLETLFLQNNPITEISRGAFKDLASLKTLDLSYTSLTQIPLALVLLSGLGSLDISGVYTLQCPCPIVVTELQLWYASYNKSTTIRGVCCSQEKITTYLNGTCQQQLPVTNTCSGSEAVLTRGFKYNCLLLLSLHVIVSFLSEYFAGLAV